MKEYKFRAWHKDTKEMLFGTPEDIFQWKEDGQPIDIMQWTGLTDKAGADLYEGDIFHVADTGDLPEGNYVVSFVEGAFKGEKINGNPGDETWCAYWDEGEIEKVVTEEFITKLYRN